MLAQLKANGIRAEIDESSDRMQAKIRDAQLQKIPYMLVIGDKEAERARWRFACDRAKT